MPDMPAQRADATPSQVEDPVLAAQAVLDDPAKAGSPEWLAAKQLIAGQQTVETKTGAFDELEREMQALRGMSEI